MHTVGLGESACCKQRFRRGLMHHFGCRILLSANQSARRCGQVLMDRNFERCPILNPCWPCANKCASTDTFASRYRCSSCMTDIEQQGSSLAASKNIGGAFAGIVSGI